MVDMGTKVDLLPTLVFDEMHLKVEDQTTWGGWKGARHQGVLLILGVGGNGVRGASDLRPVVSCG